LEELNVTIGIPASLHAVGVETAHIDDLVKIALADGCHQSNPRPVSEAQFRCLFEKVVG
jgi:alcohol dehydrogenase class IV